MTNNGMQKIMVNELRKIRNYKKWIFHSFVYPYEVEEMRERLRISGVRFRTEPVKEGGVVKGYNVYVL